MTPAAIDMSVIICAYTEVRWNELIMAVQSVQAQTILPLEIIVVVDHNPTLFARLPVHLLGVRVIENHEPRGLAGARNSGIATAQGELVAFLDDDALAAPDWLERLSVAYEDPGMLGVGGAIEPIWLGGHPTWFPDEFNWIVGCTYRGMPQTTSPVRNLIGCNMSFRRPVFQTIGGFRSGIGRVGTRPVGCEETEFCIRARQRWPRATLLYEPRAKVYHHVPANRAGWSYFRSRCYAEGLSKALVARLVGTGDGLASERAHAFRTLPQGVLRGLTDTVLHGELAGLARAGAIVAGLIITTVGYVQGTVLERFAARREACNKEREGRERLSL